MEKIDRSFLYSGILHLGLITFLAIKVAFFPTELKPVERSVRIDVVALPDKIIPTEVKPAEKSTSTAEPAKTKKAPEPTPTPKPKEEPPALNIKKKDSPKETPKEISKTQDSAIDRLKALSKIKSKVEQKKQEFKGNIVNAGSSLTGLMKIKHDEYLEKLDDHIKSFWNLPEWLNNQNLKAILRVKFNASGDLTDITIVKSSNNEIFDQKAKESIEKSMPVPAPPEDLADYFQLRGLELRFPE